ncbi:hypothetical protein GUJ93_ZPchr0227g2642 [Zizania palustris]|uniref:Uncharacterized protein n=1 Tax=Zizania palustris TaxID=103762 RepID=A0A8J5RNJ4_ZIZPA|nr:hypothetical protein GUJ93_ZPchr0227g2642 [Zizania palustris]
MNMNSIVKWNSRMAGKNIAPETQIIKKMRGKIDETIRLEDTKTHQDSGFLDHKQGRNNSAIEIFVLQEVESQLLRSSPTSPGILDPLASSSPLDP